MGSGRSKPEPRERGLHRTNRSDRSNRTSGRMVRQQRQSPCGVVHHTARHSRGVRGDASRWRGLGQRPMRASAVPGCLAPLPPPASVRQQRQSPCGVVRHTATHSRGVRGDTSPRRGSGLAPTPSLRPLLTSVPPGRPRSGPIPCRPSGSSPPGHRRPGPADGPGASPQPGGCSQ